MLKTGALLGISKQSDLARRGEGRGKSDNVLGKRGSLVEDAKDVHGSDGEDDDDLNLLLHLHLQLPDRFDRYKQNQDIREEIEHATSIQQVVDVDARPGKLSVPDLLTWGTLSDLDYADRDVKHNQDAFQSAQGDS